MTPHVYTLVVQDADEEYGTVTHNSDGGWVDCRVVSVEHVK